MWRNWAGTHACVPVAIERPKSAREVAGAVRRAAEAGRTVRAAGAGHSFSPCVPTDGTLVDLARLDRVLDADAAAGLVKVEAGITLAALNAGLREHGLALPNLGDIDAQTLAGAHRHRDARHRHAAAEPQRPGRGARARRRARASGAR